MNISGRFSRVSASTWRDGVVLVGFCGNVFPHDLSAGDIAYIKGFYMMPGSKHEICEKWPDGVSEAYPAAKTNFRSYLLLTR